MKEYAHIDTIWKRDMANKGRIIEGDYAAPELEYLANCEWVGTEKVDGTNIRVMYRPGALQLEFGGKTDNAQIPAPLIARLQALFSAAKFREKWPVESMAENPSVCLYGEGYGPRIQKGGGHYKPDGVDFVLFDVKVGDWWLKRDALEDIAAFFGIDLVPIVFRGTLGGACELVRSGLTSQWGEFAAEGLVLKPATELLKRNGDRILAKIKAVDYRGLSS